MPAIRYITLELMKEVCHGLAVDLFQKRREPIAGFDAADMALLDSAVQAPRAGFGDYEEYPTLWEKAAVLLYALIKNHAFPNGNKRIAVTTLYVFLFINDYRLTSPQDALVRYARMIAKSDPRGRARVVRNASRWVRRHSVTRR